MLNERGTRYYDIDGKPLEMMEWARMLEGRKRDEWGWRIGHTEIGEVTVSTVWIGLDHRWDEGPPLIFETMVFGGPMDDDCERYSTRQEAAEGHARMVAAVDQALGDKGSH